MWFTERIKGEGMRRSILFIIIVIGIAGVWSFGLAEDLESGKQSSSFFARFQPRVGVFGALSFPVGDVGSVLKAGFGGNVFGDLAIPLSFLNKNGLMLRGGLLLGYSSASSENTSFDARVGMVPIIAYADLGYPLQFGLVPSFRIGFGGTSVSLKDQSGGGNDTSSFDATLQIGAALGYKPFKNIEFLLSTGYAVLFEEVNGSFMYLSLGAAYHL